jgi:hypothetical protein
MTRSKAFREFEEMLDSFDPDGRPLYNMGVFGRSHRWPISVMSALTP